MRCPTTLKIDTIQQKLVATKIASLVKKEVSCRFTVDICGLFDPKVVVHFLISLGVSANEKRVTVFICSSRKIITVA